MQERVRKPKTTVTLEIDTALVAAAAAKGVDLAEALQRALEAELHPTGGRGLSDDDREAIEAHNRYVAEHGSFSDSLREFKR